MAGCRKSFSIQEATMRNVLVLILAGAFASPAFALDDTVTVQLEALGDSGQTGTATLLPEGDKTKVVIHLTGGGGVAQPAHIHLGRCDNLDPAPKWQLEAVREGQSETLLDVPLDTILKENVAINVHKSVSEASVYVACGNIVPTM
jgi:hypothetical protein